MDNTVIFTVSWDMIFGLQITTKNKKYKSYEMHQIARQEIFKRMADLSYRLNNDVNDPVSILFEIED